MTFTIYIRLACKSIVSFILQALECIPIYTKNINAVYAKANIVKIHIG